MRNRYHVTYEDIASARYARSCATAILLNFHAESRSS